ncbi:MAG: glycosyltransferase family 2 protein [Burkholderiales bacterium]|nr:glycosyltransferase family 2 protein [Burkholderiales bacterium]
MAVPALPPTARVVVLIPAHNEEVGLADTLASMLTGGSAGMRLLVVADNCTDATAGIARDMGVEVLERHNPDLRGKGYALQFGLDHLRLDAPDVVVVVDADCSATAAQLNHLAAACLAQQVPVQSVYLMHARPDSMVNAKISEFAWLVKTYVRPLGWTSLMGSCQLLGSGMAFPWQVLATRNLASGHLVEDLKLTVELAKDRVPVHFCPAVRIDSLFPTLVQSRAVQSSRWEHGHIGMIIHEFPKLMWHALRHRNKQALALGLDMLVPPLSLLVLIVWTLMGVEWALAVLTDTPAWYAEWATVLVAMIGFAVVLAWSKWARNILTARELWQIPKFVLSKVGIYRRFVTKRETDWKRADRD